MRHPQTKGGASGLFGWVISSRMHIKQENFRTERLLTSYAEPLAVFASLLGAPYPHHFVDLAYNWLLQNHGHDTIASCGRDIIAEDAMYRFRQAQEIGTCVLERAVMDIVGSIDLRSWTSNEMALVVYNPAPFSRGGVLAAFVDIPLEWKCRGFEVVDEQDRRLPMQVVQAVSPYYPVVQNPNDVANVFPSSRHEVRIELSDIPGFGYRTFRVKPVKEVHFAQPESLLTGPQTMENEYLVVSLCSNGTLKIQDKLTGRNYEGLGYFKDRGEVGNPWEHVPPVEDRVFTTLNESAEITLVRDGSLETSFQVKINWNLPQGRAEGDRARSSHFKPYAIINTITLRKGQPWVEIVTEVDNTVEDHYFQVCFPTGIQTDHVMVQGQFDVLKRSIAPIDRTSYTELPMSEHPMNSFIDLSDGDAGLAFLNEGLKAYEVQTDPEHTVGLSLIRAYPLRICVTAESMTDYSRTDKGSQCLGIQRFRYSILPHAGDWVTGKIWQASERFNLAFQACQLGPTQHGTEPLIKSFLEVQPEDLHVSGIKRSEEGRSWVVRLFNPFNETRAGRLRLNGGYSGPSGTLSPVDRVKSEFALPPGKGKQWQAARLLTLEETPAGDLGIDGEGWVDFEIGKKQILTLEFVP
jgi:hypothetical protein